MRGHNCMANNAAGWKLPYDVTALRRNAHVLRYFPSAIQISVSFADEFSFSVKLDGIWNHANVRFQIFNGSAIASAIKGMGFGLGVHASPPKQKRIKGAPAPLVSCGLPATHGKASLNVFPVCPISRFNNWSWAKLHLHGTRCGPIAARAAASRRRALGSL
ncbi:hypothetical protein EVAR_12892_1 [Eumeta japonica]|uniref:Uncharacterized protein n=1 Tax=Eumeta variegata TaxID=151549 RepID=A0A4C1TVP5_EUMVA|nr:hypothetical protein EVAR_12892_1 [Eumeta japonica]